MEVVPMTAQSYRRASAALMTNLGGLQQVQLENVYRWPMFPEVMRVAFGDEELAQAWRVAISQIARTASVLEIGGGTGRLTTQLARRPRAQPLTVVERDPLLAQSLRAKVGDRPTEIRECEFPCTGISPHDVLCLHQNTLLELLNEKGWAVIDSLRDVSRPGSLILTDCVQPAVTPSQEGILFDGIVKDEISVRYSYRCAEKSGDFVRANLNYRVCENSSVVHDFEATVLIWLPPLEDIERRFGLAGFRTRRIAITDAATFFPGQMFLLHCERYS